MVRNALLFGFCSSVILWCVIFLGQLPFLSIPSWINGLAIIAAFVITHSRIGASRQASQAARIGAASGAVCGLINLLLLGSLLVSQPTHGEPTPGVGGLKPNAAVTAIGFVLACTIAGAIAAWLGTFAWKKTLSTAASPTAPSAHPSQQLADFTWILALAILPLLLIGGFVTSADAGMSVRGWPESSGAFMFLYPLSLMTDHRVFFEHSHRLFGALVGLTTLVTTIWIWIEDRRGWVRALASIVLVFVGIQAVLGGVRVNLDSRVIGLIHGISAQVIFALACCLAAVLGASYRSTEPASRQQAAKRLRTFSTILVISLLVQLSLGAMYRHLGTTMKGATHALYTHAAFSLVVMIFASATGFQLKKLADPTTGVGRAAGRVGRVLAHGIGLQFLLGWVAFWAVLSSKSSGAVPGSTELATTPMVPLHEQLIATAHQILGALMVAFGVLAALWTRRAIANPDAPPATTAR